MSEENKQETSEEAAEIFFKNTRLRHPKSFFIEGASWQKERMYSEEELIQLLEEYDKHIQKNFSPSNIILSTKEWFEQNKKKSL